MTYSLRTLLFLLLLGPPMLADLHHNSCLKVANLLLPRLTRGWDVKSQAQILCLGGVTPRITIQEEDEDKLGINVEP